LDNKDDEIFLRYPLIFDHRHYVPCIRWKLGEYQALLRLKLDVKDSVTPLIEIPEIGWDFETEEDAKTIDEHLKKFATRFTDKWSHRWAFVDLKLIDPNERMVDGRHPLKFVFDDLRNKEGFAIPVTGLHRDNAYQDAVADAISRDRSGVCMRISIGDIASPDFQLRLDGLLEKLAVEPEKVHFVIDLEAPKFEPLEGFTKMVLAMLKKVPHLEGWATYSVCGTSFPETMGQLSLGVHIVKRYEWLFYKRLLKNLPVDERKPAFGDYAISHPNTKAIDMRFVKPAASIRYTIDDAWYIVKGPNVRDHGTAQYVKYCAALLKSGSFSGSSFSAADEYLRKCALRQATPGRHPTWRWVGTNHHVEKAVSDIANLNGS
jgi:hypothetical protein